MRWILSNRLRGDVVKLRGGEATDRTYLFWDRNGQMAIFVALIFQILFIFFALAINIALVVHDKINLQNAVDLAAFYAAEKQAEMLNVIAHTNYQIRQSWKLLNWRYYVLGSMGQRDPRHPAFASNDPRTENYWLGPSKAPTMCITYGNWPDTGGGQDNTCKTQNFGFENIRLPIIVAPFAPMNLLFLGFAKQIQNKIANTCDGYGGLNWLYSAWVYSAFVRDQRSRKELIRKLAANLERKPDEILDLDGSTILAGAKNTFFKNLTRTNQGQSKGAQTQPDFELFNSLEGLEQSKWLPEIDIKMAMLYQMLRGTGSNCDTTINTIDVPPSGNSWEKLKQATGTSEEELRNLQQFVTAALSIGATSDWKTSLGVEKNPYIWAYMGVRAKTRPRQLFFPFGDPIEFTAQAFAKPFGGRIGPQYGKSWSRAAQTSSGAPMQLGPPRLLANGMLNSADQKLLIPAYSKYPGDRVGLRSYLAQNSLEKQANLSAYISNYGDISRDMGPSEVNDILARPSIDGSSNIRSFEIAAIAPDLFDLTYYSIQPAFGDRYLAKLRDLKDGLGLPDFAFPRGDLGSTNGENAQMLNVKDQIRKSQNFKFGEGVINLHMPDAFWSVRDWSHLLTGWVPKKFSYGNYFEFPDDRFGKCEAEDTTSSGIAPGNCLDGGRVGYSVKIVSQDMFKVELESSTGEAAGAILNPPPEGW